MVTVRILRDISKTNGCVSMEGYQKELTEVNDILSLLQNVYRLLFMYLSHHLKIKTKVKIRKLADLLTVFQTL